MKLLIVGQGDSVFFEKYTKNLKNKNPNIEIHIFSFDPITGRNNLSSCEKTVYNNWNKSIFSKIKGVRTIIYPFYNSLSLYSFLSKNKFKYDVIHYKWLNSLIVLSYLFIKKFSHRTIATFWGGELISQKILFSRKIYLLYLKKFLNKVDIITYATDESLNELSEISLDKSKLKQAIYGSDIIKEIQAMLLIVSKNACKLKLGIDSSKTTITLGYSGKPIHQHILLINALIENDTFMKLKNSFVLIIPFTYGGTQSYMNEIEDKLIENNLNYLFINTKQTEKEIAEIRLASDIVIQATLFDGRSSSIIEFLLAGSIMISADWLPYKLFKDKQIHFYEVNMFDAKFFPELIISIHENIQNELEMTAENANKWGFNETWEGVISDWNSLYYKEIDLL